MSQIGIGIVGYGGFGQFLRQSWAGLSDVAVVAVADANPAVAPEGLTVYREWRHLLGDPAVDIVSIATPPSTHAEIACAAMDAGKHVLVEKPIATTLEDAREICDRHARTDVVATVDFMLRFNPIVEILQAWAHEGPFGPLRRVLVENYAQDEALHPQHWFWDERVSGGILVEHAVHFIDLVHACTRAPATRVDGVSVARSDGRVDRMGLTATYADGLVMTQYHAFSRPGFFESTSMRFVFDLAEVDVNGWIPLSGRARMLVSDASEEALHQLPGVRVKEKVLTEDLGDASRPAGRGDSGLEQAHGRDLRSAGIAYPVRHQIDAEFAISADKATVYTRCLQALMQDVVRAIRDSKHTMRVTLDDGLKSLAIALQASESARTPSTGTIPGA